MKIAPLKLSNGLRFLLIPLKNTQTVTAMVLVGTGSEYESREENGLAHFLEHMCFKGTIKRPTAQDIVYELDSIGASYNAFTGGVYTGYFAKSHKKHARKILDIISDIYLNSTFPDTEIKKERDVIIQEIKMKEDKPASKVGEVLDELLYGDHPAGRPITGTEKSVSTFSRKNFLSYHKKFYTPKNTVVVISGAFNTAHIKKDIENYFKQMKSASVVVKPKVIVSQKKPAVKVHFKKTEQTHLYMAFRAFNMFDKRLPAAQALSTALGGGMSSRLFSKIREQLGLCYYIHCSMGAGLDDGTFTIKAGVGNNKLEQAVKAILTEVKNIRDEGVTDQELRKVKDYRLSGLVLGLETSDDYAEYYGFQELMRKKLRTPEESAKIIEGVTVVQIKKVAQDIFREEGLNLAIVGPHKEKNKVLKILSF